jgi:tetratricopeptide (TPR) repeat protein
MTRPWKSLLPLALTACLVLAAWIIIRERDTPKSGSEALNRAVELQKAGRYDKAIEILETWMKGNNRNTSHDGFLYQQIAMIYIARAYAKPRTRGESVRRAEENLQKELTLFDGQSQTDLSLDPFEIGGGYEILGDLSDKDKCRFYEKARGLFERQLPLIKGDSYTSLRTHNAARAGPW